ncbi:hypothetical protein K1719_019939 [Acacia pycnantha]|nr:hypothetical protein K1719_019939 [Acacia pycnantha]
MTSLRWEKNTLVKHICWDKHKLFKSGCIFPDGLNEQIQNVFFDKLKDPFKVPHSNFCLEISIFGLQADPSYKNDKYLHFQRELLMVPLTLSALSSQKVTT